MGRVELVNTFFCAKHRPAARVIEYRPARRQSMFHAKSFDNRFKQPVLIESQPDQSGIHGTQPDHAWFGFHSLPDIFVDLRYAAQPAETLWMGGVIAQKIGAAGFSGDNQIGRQAQSAHMQNRYRHFPGRHDQMGLRALNTIDALVDRDKEFAIDLEKKERLSIAGNSVDHLEPAIHFIEIIDAIVAGNIEYTVVSAKIGRAATARNDKL